MNATQIDQTIERIWQMTNSSSSSPNASPIIMQISDNLKDLLKGLVATKNVKVSLWYKSQFLFAKTFHCTIVNN